MPATPLPDPFRRLSWLDRRRWSLHARRVVREFEAETLADLRSLAGSGVQLDWMSERSAKTLEGTAGTAPGLAGPVEFSAGGKRVVVAAVWAPAWESLVGAWRGAAVTLAGAGRYHRSWVLRFRVAVASGPQAGAAREFVLLGSRVRLLDHWGGQARDGGVFGLPLTPAALV
ncbi:MAG TPA: hypothetical protein VNF71_03270 [Acidimicrobiales bacterium]|nr:hypothetical protein [Acidimicrobiales bacterium]